MADVRVLDLNFMGSHEVIATGLIASADGLILVDCGPGSTLAHLHARVLEAGFALADIRHLLLTHIHLDHAGAAGTLAREHGTRVYVHAHGARHLERPERLLESATRIYGAMMEPLWGAFEPVPAEQLVVLEGGETLLIGGVEVGAVYTPGHAIHHLAYRVDDAVFTGDVGGVRLPGASHVLAPTPPPDVDLEAWRDSVRKLRALDAKRLFLAHFGEVTDVPEHLDRLEASLDALERLSLEGLRAGEDRDAIALRIRRLASEEIRREADKTLEMRYELSTPYAMAADGLVRYWTRKRPEALI